MPTFVDVIMGRKKKKYGLLLFLFLTSLYSYSQPNWSYTITSTNHTILIQNSIEISIDGVQISVGDYIGVFFDSLGTSACGGYIVWQGNSTALAAWGSQPGLNDGFTNGEEFQWRIWSAANQQEYEAVANYNSTMFPNQGNYTTNGMSGLTSLVAISPVSPHPQWNFTTSAFIHKIVIADSVPLTFNNTTITTGDYIGVFFDSAGVLSCGGYIQRQAESDTLIAYGDSSGQNGFIDSEVFTWKVWRANDQSESIADVSYNTQSFPDSSFFVDNGLSGLAQLSATTGPDISVLEILNPLNSCGQLSTNEGIDVLLINSGDENITGFDVQLTINGWDTIVSVSSVNTQPGDSLLLSNLIYYDFSLAGSYSLQVVASLVNDFNYENDSLSTIIDIFQLPQLNFTGLDSIQCFSTSHSIILEASPANGYFFGTNIIGNEFFPVSLGISIVEYNYTDQITGCTNQITQQVNVLESPQIDLGDDITACSGDTVLLEVPAGFVNYAWSTGATQTSSVEVVSSGIYSVTVLNINLCTASDSVNITFNTVPYFQIYGSPTACDGDTVELDAGEAYDFYQWGDTNIVYSQFLQVSESGTYSCTVSYNSCNATDSFSVSFNPRPEIEITGQDTACEGDMVTLMVDTGFSYYVWSGSYINTPSYPVFFSGNYWVMVVNEFNCSSIDSFEVTFFSKPLIDFGNIPRLCEGDSFDLFPCYADSYLWSDNSTDPTYTVSQSGDYSVTVSKNSCISSKEINIQFFSRPDVSFEYSTSFNTVSFKNNSDISETYKWDFGDNSYSNLFEPIHQYSDRANYIVTLEASNYCGTNSYFDTVSIYNIEDGRDFYLPVYYPNPGNGKFMINFPVLNSNYFSLVVYDDAGNMVFSENNIMLNKFEYKLELDLSFLSQGTYHAKWTTGNLSFTNKLIIIK